LNLTLAEIKKNRKFKKTLRSKPIVGRRSSRLKSGTFFVAERSWVNWGLLPEGTAASPMLTSSIGWTSPSLGVGGAEAVNFFPVEPGRRGSREAFFTVARS
jgi:hypothetical protein